MRFPDAKSEPDSGLAGWGNIGEVVASADVSCRISDRVGTGHSQEESRAADSPLGYAETLAVEDHAAHRF